MAYCPDVMDDDSLQRTMVALDLPERVTEELLYELFLQAGPLKAVTIPQDRYGRPKSYAFVEFKHPESVNYAISIMNGIHLPGGANFDL
ncbi:unnamed protein product [Darwinula stevensoni]|uniref:RRM domain-containing protein n=1 Tax=Darwinula stevensoni TaxID=69355 RepID=A0A7R8ZY41_9CRUS|nr:unnamed protein product [Darwinula stevensoni]CAG0879675.1 unnamed protein product [Darwinula stevensoni]